MKDALGIYIRGTLTSLSDQEVPVSGAGMAPEDEGCWRCSSPSTLHLRGILDRGVREGSFGSDLAPEDTSDILFHMIGSGRRLIHMGREPAHVADTITGLILRSVSA